MKKNLHYNIRFHRKRKGLTQTELAEKIGVKGKTVIANWESGLSNPKNKAVENMAELFNISVHKLKNERT